MHTRKLVTVWIMIALALTLLPQPVKAEQPAPGQVSVILIMDNSGSMKTSDPADLRFTAVRLFISLLDEGDQVGLILFSTQSHTLTGGLVTLYGEAEKRKLLNQTQFAAADGYTDIKAALLDARDMLPMAQGGAGKTVVILLTDGKPEISQPYAAYEDEALDVARTLGVPVLSIALMTAAQTPFLNRLAAQTGGLVVPAEDAADLLDAYLEVFSQIKDRTVIGSGLAQSPGNAALEIDPALAPYITKVSFILSKPDNIQSKFLAPSGEEITPESSGVASFLADDPRFVVIIMHHPAGGGWNFQLSGQGMVMRRAILHSRLRSAITSPGRFHQAGQPMPIVVSLIEQKDDGQTTKIIGDAAFSALITLPDGKQESLDRFYDDGTHGDARANDGDYTRLFVNTDQPGSYDVAIRGWKGVIPVERSARVEIVPFPAIIVDEPTGEYEIRGQPLTIRVHPEGGTPPQLDRGELTARITTPSGKTQEVTLTGSDGVYTAEFMPAEDGVYKVQIEARDAAYKGLPYNLTAQASFIVQIIPSLTFQTKEVDLGRVEMATAKQGMTVPIKVLSTSQRTELVDVKLEDAPGLALADNGPFSISPSESVINLQLVTQSGAVSGAVAGRLVFSAQQKVDLLGAEIPLHLELFQPSLRLTSAPLRAEIPSGCFNKVGEMTITFALDSAQAETIHLNLEGVEGLRLSPQALELSMGEQQVTLEILPIGDALPVGEYEATLHVEGRDGLTIYPQADIQLHLVAPSLLVRCRRPIAWGGILLLAFLAAGLIIARKIKAATRLPLVTGTLRYWPVEKGPANAAEEDLTAFEKTAILIGHGGTCDLALPDLDEQHAILRAEKSADEVEILLEPLGEVRKGYGLILARTPLRHGDTFRMVTYEFQYLSDKGE